MCRYCGGIVSHLPRCPEYNDAADRTGLTCADCGEPVLHYEGHTKIKGKAYHTECLENMGIRDLLTMLGYQVEGE